MVTLASLPDLGIGGSFPNGVGVDETDREASIARADGQVLPYRAANAQESPPFPVAAPCRNLNFTPPLG